MLQMEARSINHNIVRIYLPGFCLEAQDPQCAWNPQEQAQQPDDPAACQLTINGRSCQGTAFPGAEPDRFTAAQLPDLRGVKGCPVIEQLQPLSGLTVQPCHKLLGRYGQRVLLNSEYLTGPGRQLQHKPDTASIP